MDQLQLHNALLIDCTLVVLAVILGITMAIALAISDARTKRKIGKK